MKNIYRLCFTFFLILGIMSSAYSQKLDVRIGAGKSILGTGDYWPVNIENELNYHVHSYFTLSTVLGYGFKNDNTEYRRNVNFLSGSINAFFVPFQNHKVYEGRVGLGLNYYKVSDSYRSSGHYVNDVLIDETIKFDTRTALGINFILENSIRIQNKYILGLKLFITPYENDDINSGIIVKLGTKI